MPPSDWQGPPKFVKKTVNGKTVDTTVCSPAIYGTPSEPQKLFLIGDRAMRRLYTVFDRDNSRVGFA